MYCIIDIETCSFANGILECAGIKVNKNFEIISSSSEIEVRTNIEWPVNHISGVVRPVGRYSEKEAILILKNFISSDIIVGFNLVFEERWFKKFGFMFVKKIDLMKEMQSKFSLKKYSLSDCAEIFRIKEIHKHTALGDCLTLYEIMRRLYGARKTETGIYP